MMKKNKTLSRTFIVHQTLSACCLAFVAACLPISGCAQSKSEQPAATVKQGATAAPIKHNMLTTPWSKPIPPAAWSNLPERMSLEKKYAVEIAMGADCPKKPSSTAGSWGQAISDGACFGRLPNDSAQFLLALSAQRQTLLHQAAYQQLFESVKSDNKYTFRAVPGFGQNPDILIGLSGGAWVRSFEGTDPAITMYLVRAPFICNKQEWRAAKKIGRHAIEPCKDPMRIYEMGFQEDPTLRLRLFRVENEGVPEDVTATLLPPLPSLTMTERKRYGRQMSLGDGGVWRDDKGNIGLPDDTNLFMWTGILQYAPTLRWWLDLGPDYPLSESDPRGPGREAHFGFLIWTGQRFEMRERVPRSFAPCGVSPDGTISKCVPGTDPNAQIDRFIIEAK